MKYFFLVMITGKMFFLFPWQPLLRKNLFIKSCNFNQIEKSYSRKIVKKVYPKPCSPALRSETRVILSKYIKNYFFWFLLPFVIMYISKDLICCLTCVIFLKYFWWPVWIFSVQIRLNFQMNLLKVKITKERKKAFCGPSNIFKNIS